MNHHNAGPLRMLLSFVAVSAIASAAIQGPVAPQAMADTAPTFYTPPSPLPAGRSGDVIRHERLATTADLGGVIAKAQRILYLSTDVANRPIPISATVLTPSLPWLGRGARPIVGVAVSTHGMGDRCAPSRQLSELGPEYEVPNLLQLLRRGYGVVVTDYQGLGTPGTHTYLNPTAAAHAVLDSIRAAQRLPEAGLPDAGPVGIMGYSQGGGAAAASAELQPTYAPELKLKGVFAGGVPADPRALMANLNGSLGSGLVGYFLAGLRSAYPKLPVAEMLSEQGTELVAATARECWYDTVQNHAFVRHETLTRDGRPVAERLGEPPFRSVLARMVLGRRQPGAPVMVLQSPLDELVPYRDARRMARRWCRLGANVQFDDLLVQEHVAALYEGNVRAGIWLAARFAGKPAQSECGTI